MTSSTLRLLLAFGLLTSGCARHVYWTERIAAGCTAHSGDPALDREQTYLALLLALKDLRYGIVRTEPGQAVDAIFAGDYRPEQARTAWQVRVLDDGSYSVDAPSTRREMHPRSPERYALLVQYQARYQCRSLDWLRWEAQNHGLVPVGAAAGESEPLADPSEPQPAVASAGGEREVVARQLRIAALLEQRAQISLRRPAAAAGAGVFLAAVGGSVLVQAYLPRSCEISDEDCADIDRTLKLVGGPLLAVGAITLGIALPITLRRVRAYRDLGRELKLLRSTEIRLSPGPLGLGLTLAGRF